MAQQAVYVSYKKSVAFIASRLEQTDDRDTVAKTDLVGLVSEQFKKSRRMVAKAVLDIWESADGESDEGLTDEGLED